MKKETVFRDKKICLRTAKFYFSPQKTSDPSEKSFGAKNRACYPGENFKAIYKFYIAMTNNILYIFNMIF